MSVPRSIAGCLVLLGLLLAPLVFDPTKALAVKPETTRTDFVDQGGVLADCGGFQIFANYSGTTRTTLFFNSQGDPIRLLIQGRARGTLTNMVTGYSVEDGPSVLDRTLDFVKGTETDVGVLWHVKAPGQGTLLIEAGRLVFAGDGPPIFIAGQHRPPPETNAILCGILS